MSGDRRVLMIAPYFPPRRRVGALRPFKFASHLRAFGWTPIVVCLDTPGESLTDAEREALEGIEVVRLDSPLDRTRGGASGSDQSTRHAPSPVESTQLALPRALQGPFSRLAGRVKGVADRADASVPLDTWWPVLRYHQLRIEQLAQDRDVDVVWSTGDPWSAHALAKAVAKGPNPAVATVERWLGRQRSIRSRPWVADFRDPWTLCKVRNAGRPWATRAVDEQFERSIFASADRVVFTAETASERYRRHYEGLSPQVSTIVNGFDADLFGIDPDRLVHTTIGPWPAREDGVFEILFFGRFRALSPAMPVIAMLAQLRRIDPGAFARVRVRSVGPLGSRDAEAAEQAGVLEAFEVTEAVPYERALERLRAADVLLVSSGDARDDMIPAKLWDYLPAGRPIVSLAANAEVGQVLEATGLGVHFGVDAPLPAAQFVAEAVARKLEGGAVPELYGAANIQAYDVRALTQRLAALFDELVGLRSGN